MLFLRYESFRQYIRYYPVTSLILLINLLLFFAVLFSSYERSEALVRFGAIHNLAGGSEPYTYVTSVFLHGSFDHLLFNSFALFVFAPPMERLLGKFRYALLYLVSGVMGNVFSEYAYTSVLGRPYISVGASGAVYGLFGAYLFLILFRKGALDFQSKKTIQIILVVGVIYSLLMANINLYAHLGGFVAGLVLFGLLMRRDSRWN